MLVVATATMAKRSLMSTKIVNLIYIACFAFCQTTNFVISVRGVLGPQVFLRISCKLCRVRLACQRCIKRATTPTPCPASAPFRLLRALIGTFETRHSTPLHSTLHATLLGAMCVGALDTVILCNKHASMLPQFMVAPRIVRMLWLLHLFSHMATRCTLHVARCKLRRGIHISVTQLTQLCDMSYAFDRESNACAIACHNKLWQLGKRT